MENEIRVGEYVRDWNGQIARIIKINEYKTKPKVIYTDIIIDVNEDRACNENIIDEDTIVKHSHNLIDLIQCGDYVNGIKIISIIQQADTMKTISLCGFDNRYLDIKLNNRDIKTIVTKEQFESISYKVKE